MSKKSRRRNRKILGALAAGLGAMALMKGRRANQMSGMETVSDAQKVSSQLGARDVTGTVYPGANKVAADSTAVDTSKGNWTGYGHPIIRGNVKRKKAFEEQMTTPGMGTANYPGANPYRAPVRTHNRFNRGVNVSYAKGGRVKGVGKAKRGFGRALKGGK